MVDRRFRPSSPRRWRIVLTVGACATLCSPAARGQDEPEALRLARVHSAFVLNFARYATWPHGALEPAARSFVIEVFGSPALARQLRQITSDERVHDLPIEVHETSCPRDPTDRGFRERLRRVHLVYIGSGSERCFSAILDALDGAPVLTVGEPRGFVEAGGMVELLRRQDRVRFAANLDALRAHEIHLSSRVLELAESLRGHE